jgi:hypothetical protein
MTVILNKNLIKKQKTIYDIMKFFKGTARTEGAFYLRFQQMSKGDINLLMGYYEIEEEWQVFKKICKFWNIN